MNYERASATVAGRQGRGREAAVGGRRPRLGGVGYHCCESLFNFLLLLFIDFVRMHNQQTLPNRLQLDPSRCELVQLSERSFGSRASGRAAAAA